MQSSHVSRHAERAAWERPVAHRFGGTSVLRCPGLSTRSRWPCCFRLCQERGERGFIHPAKALGAQPTNTALSEPAAPQPPRAPFGPPSRARDGCATLRSTPTSPWRLLHTELVCRQQLPSPQPAVPRRGGPRPRSTVSPGRGQPGAPTHWEAAVSRGSLSTTFLGGWGRGCSPKPAAPPGTPSLSPAFGCHIPGLSPSSLAIGAPSPRKLWRRPQKGSSAPPGDANAGGGCRGRAQAFLAGPGRAAPA